MIKIAQKHNRRWKGSKSEKEERENPTIGEVISSNEEIITVWDRFQYGISKEEMYPDQAATITEVVDTMRQLPVVGKDICYTHYRKTRSLLFRNISEGGRNTAEADHRV